MGRIKVNLVIIQQNIYNSQIQLLPAVLTGRKVDFESAKTKLIKNLNKVARDPELSDMTSKFRSELESLKGDWRVSNDAVLGDESVDLRRNSNLEVWVRSGNYKRQMIYWTESKTNQN